MALYVKDGEMDRLAKRLAAIQRVSKTEAVPRALTHELEWVGATSSLAERGMAFARALRNRAVPERGKLADEAFIESLYADD